MGRVNFEQFSQLYGVCDKIEQLCNTFLILKIKIFITYLNIVGTEVVINFEGKISIY